MIAKSHKYCEDEFKRLTELDRICPKCKTSEHIYRKYHDVFNIEFFLKDDTGDRIDTAVQFTYTCSVCGSVWKGLPFAESENRNAEKYTIFTQLADLKLKDLKYIKAPALAWFIIGLVIGLLYFISH